MVQVEFEAEWITFVRQRFSIDNNQKTQAINWRKEKSIPKFVEFALKEKSGTLAVVVVEHLRTHGTNQFCKISYEFRVW